MRPSSWPVLRFRQPENVVIDPDFGERTQSFSDLIRGGYYHLLRQRRWRRVVPGCQFIEHYSGTCCVRRNTQVGHLANVEVFDVPTDGSARRGEAVVLTALRRVGVLAALPTHRRLVTVTGPAPFGRWRARRCSSCWREAARFKQRCAGATPGGDRHSPAVHISCGGFRVPSDREVRLLG